MLNCFRCLPVSVFLTAAVVASCARHDPARYAAPVASATAPQSSAGYRREQLVDTSRGVAGKGRPIWVDVWYPAPRGSQLAPQNYSLKRYDVARDAAVDVPALRGFALLSHGAGGSADNYAWLATELARSGFAVAGIHHYGESRLYGEGSVDKLSMFRAWERVADVVFVRQALLASEFWGPLLAELPLFGIGHSAGGHTMLGAAGVPYDLSRMGQFCTERRPTGAAARDCQYGDSMTPEEWRAVGLPPAGPSEKVDGFQGLLLFEPAIGPSFEAENLAALQVPVHVVASRPGDFLSFEAHAKHIVDAVPKSTLLVLSGGEGHFIFLEECTYDISVLGLALCEDAPGVSRVEAHRTLVQDALIHLEGWAH